MNFQSIGVILAMLVLVVAVVLMVIGQVPVVIGALLAGLALARMLP